MTGGFHLRSEAMAVVILGGLLTSTRLNLFVVPALYLRFARTRTSAVRLVEGL